MKKFAALILTLIMMVSISSVASAVSFDIVTTSKDVYQVGTQIFSTNNYNWFINVNMGTSNIALDHRAVVRVHQGVNAASATWVYGAPNGASHPYISGYKDGLTFRGRLDNRDSGLLEFHGTFYN
ncbi:MAG: hypothetical protein RR037_07890 [Alistipes sp.]